MRLGRLFFAIFLLVSFAIFFIACSSRNEKEIEVPQCVIAQAKAPSWVCGTYTEEDRLLAVGSAILSKLGYDFTRREALANARASLAHQINLEVKAKIETYMNTAGLGGNEAIQKVTTIVSKQTSNTFLKESKQVSFWENPNDKYIYVLVAISKSNIDKNIDDEIKKVLNEL